MSYSQCTMGVGCDEAGVCFALANGEPERCDKPFEGLVYSDWSDNTFKPEPDPADIIAGTLPCSRATAYDYMVRAIQEAPVPFIPAGWIIRHDAFESMAICTPITGVGFTIVTKDRGALSERVRYELCEALIGPRPERETM